MPDGSSLYAWGYSDVDGMGTMGMGSLPPDTMQYPGPTLFAQAGDTVSIMLHNNLAVPTSIVFPGIAGVEAQGDAAGLLTIEAAPGGGMATYTFMAARPGTFLYHSGTQPDLQVEMVLVGALIVRPATADLAYDTEDSRYDHEALFLLTEIDPQVHDHMEIGRADQVDVADFWPTIWLINGRAAPDTMADDFVPWLPHQPYGCMPAMHPGERLLLRFVGGGRDLHPFHTHGNHSAIIARDAHLLQSAPGLGADLAEASFTTTVAPGQTIDSIFEWNGAGLGWDIYGHDALDPLEPGEDPASHGKPFPVIPPEPQSLTFGPNWSGSPFLGIKAGLPPGNGNLNANGEYYYMWHSHNEREMVTFDMFPGGMMTMLAIQPHGVPIR